jgi:hypothetical protein
LINPPSPSWALVSEHNLLYRLARRGQSFAELQAGKMCGAHEGLKDHFNQLDTCGNFLWIVWTVAWKWMKSCLGSSSDSATMAVKDKIKMASGPWKLGRNCPSPKRLLFS